MIEVSLKILHDLFYSKWWRSTVAIGLIPIVTRLVLAKLFYDDMKYFSVSDVSFFGLALNLSCILEMESLKQWARQDKLDWCAFHFLVMVCGLLFLGALLSEHRHQIDLFLPISLVFATVSLIYSHALFCRLSSKLKSTTSNT